MANNQSQNSSSKSQANINGNGNGSSSSTHKPAQHSQSTSSSSASSPSTHSVNASSTSGGGDAIELYISKGVRSLLDRIEPELNRIGTQIVNRAMSRGQNLADTGVKRMQDQPWYMVGGALALVAVGVGLLFTFENQANEPDFSKAQ